MQSHRDWLRLTEHWGSTHSRGTWDSRATDHQQEGLAERSSRKDREGRQSMASAHPRGHPQKITPPGSTGERAEREGKQLQQKPGEICDR